MIRILVALLALLLSSVAAEAQPFQRTAGTITTAGTDCTTATACVRLEQTERTSNAIIVLGAGWTGTVNFEATFDNPTLASNSKTWVALNVSPTGGGGLVTSATTTGQWSAPIPTTGIRVRASTLSSGSVPVTILATSSGGGGSGTITNGSLTDNLNRAYTVPQCSRGTVLCTEGAMITLTDTTETTLIAAGGAGVFNDLAYIKCSNTSATGVRVDIRDATAGTVRDSFYLPATSNQGAVFQAPWKQTTAANNWTVQLSGSVTDVRCRAQAIQNQ